MKKETDTIEAELISALKHGSRKAFESIYQMYSKRLYAYSLQLTKSSAEAEEIVQEVFIKLWVSRTQIRQEESLQSLLFIMSKHYFINAYRAKINHPVYEEYIDYKDVLSTENVHQQLEYEDFLRIFRQSMEELPVTQKKVIRLSRMEQLTNREIADKLSLSEQTVKNQLSLGLKSLREKLNKLIALLVLVFIN